MSRDTHAEKHDTEGLVNLAKSRDAISVADSPSLRLVDTTAALSEMVGLFKGLPTEPPSLYVDLEGVNLSRHGHVSILQIHVLPCRRTYLVDIHLLHDKAFSTPADNGYTLKEILESGSIPKVFFDVRNDSDALHSHFGICLAGIHDLQLMELATRNFSRRHINGLSKCIERDAPLSQEERIAWMLVKEKGQRLFAPEKGGTYEVFNERPLHKDVILYCAQDVQILPRLHTYYGRKLTAAWKAKVLEASQNRVELSQTATFNGKGRHMALAPYGWY
ncbi:exonuclease [Stachybotrys elegans]|uniref:Exonuclease n=1 Tax=Stachybotrys elegans TaxID=80388 RepID=A0A8K0SGA3_9HYPO|nr:exonuclease [Stachybotrys elegans]